MALQTYLAEGLKVLQFAAQLQIIGVNPFVFVPESILAALFEQAGKDRGPIPIRGTLNGQAYRQTLVRYSGAWRLYVNLTMLENSPKRIGETVEIWVEFDPDDRTIDPHPKLLEALEKNPAARAVFEGLSPSLRLEIVRYISRLKSEETVADNFLPCVWKLSAIFPA